MAMVIGVLTLWHFNVRSGSAAFPGLRLERGLLGKLSSHCTAGGLKGEGGKAGVRPGLQGGDCLYVGILLRLSSSLLQEKGGYLSGEPLL